MKSEKAFKKNLDFVTRKIDTELILMPLTKTSSDLRYLYTFNPPAAKVWELIDGKRTWSQIKKQLRGKFLDEYNTTPKEIDREFWAFLKDLKKIKAVK